MRAARDIQPFFVDLDIDDRPRWSGAVYQVSVANGRYHGGGLTVAEDAAIDDGKLDLYVVYPGTFWQLFACVTHLRFGLMKPDVLDRHTATRVKLRTDKSPSVDADGRLATKTPAAFSLIRKGLTVIVPRTLPANHRGFVALDGQALSAWGDLRREDDDLAAHALGRESKRQFAPERLSDNVLDHGALKHRTNSGEKGTRGEWVLRGREPREQFVYPRTPRPPRPGSSGNRVGSR